MTNTAPTLLIGQAIGQAEASLTRVLAGVLAESETSRDTYLSLQRLAVLGGQATRDAYERHLSDWLALDRSPAARLASDLIADGLAAEHDGSIGLTEKGRALREAILAGTTQITGPILATIDPDHLEITVRTLDEITSRARRDQENR